MENKSFYNTPDSRKHGDDLHISPHDDFDDFANEKAKDEERVYDLS